MSSTRKDAETKAGKTSRIRNHFFGNGAETTKKFMPLEVLDIIECRSVREEVEHVENMVTENLFETYGEENVYGGKYCNSKK